MIVISDTSPIIFFAKIEKLSLLKQLYSEIVIPNAVWEGLTYPLSKPDEKIPADITHEIKAKEEGWLIVKNPKSEEYHEVALNLTKELGRGEAYAIALSLELKADILLINDKKARTIAESKGITTKWSSDILLDALEKKYITDYQEFKDLLDELIKIGMWMQKSKYDSVLDIANKIMKE